MYIHFTTVFVYFLLRFTNSEFLSKIYFSKHFMNFEKLILKTKVKSI